MGRLKISPSMMCADFIHLGADLDLFKESGIDYLHIDVMDGHYVPNFTLGPDYCRALAAYSDIPLDIHLMIENADSYVPVFSEFKNSVISFHPECIYHPLRTVQFIKSFGVRAGIAIDPVTPLESIKYMLPDIDLICIMAVSPGYSGQKLIPQAIGKIQEISRYIKERGYQIEIEVDGNVSWENIPKMLQAGAEVLVAGTSSIFKQKEGLQFSIEKLKSMLVDFEK
jgi:ribulose-phosphate 3-epimerase